LPGTINQNKDNTMPTLSQIIRSKTMLFSVALAVLSVSQGFIVQLALTPMQQSIVGMVIAGAIAALRVITTTSLADK
jgi:hypothetical protein